MICIAETGKVVTVIFFLGCSIYYLCVLVIGALKNNLKIKKKSKTTVNVKNLQSFFFTNNNMVIVDILYIE